MPSIIVAANRGLAAKYRSLLSGTDQGERPTILTWPDLLREISAKLQVAPEPLLTPLQTSFLIRQASLEMADELQEYGSIARTKGFWRDLTRSIQDGLVHQHTDLERIRERYDRLVESTGCTDLPGRYRQLAVALKQEQNLGLWTDAEARELQIVGLEPPAGFQRELLEALALHGIRYTLHSSVLPSAGPDKIRLVYAAEPYGEVDGLARFIKDLLSAGKSLADIAVIYPSEQYLSLLEKGFARYNLPTRSDRQIPLTRLSLVQSLLTKYRARKDMSFPEFVRAQVDQEQWIAELRRSSSSDHRRLAALELRGVEALLQAASQAAESLELITGTDPVSPEDFQVALELAVEATALWEEPYPRPGIRCFSLANAQGVTAKHLFFVGLTQQVLGQRREEWLPDLGRKVEPTAVLDLLLGEGPASAVLSHPAADTKGALQLAPVYFAEIAGRWPDKVEKLTLKRYKPLPSTQARPRAGLHTAGDLGPITADLPPLRGASLPVSHLETYLRCPFSYYAEKLLGLDRRDSEIAELQALDEGSVIHGVMQRFYEKSTAPLEMSRRFEYLARMEQLLDEVLAHRRETVSEILPGAWAVGRARILGFLTRALEEELNYYAQGYELIPTLLEQEITPLELATSTGTIRLTGRIDRIDTDGRGNWLLYDYKGPEISRSEIADCRRLQLAVYAAAWSRLLTEEGKPPASIGVCYFSYKKAKRTVYLPKDGETEEWLKLALQVAQNAVEGIITGDFRPAPAKVKDCEKCSWSGLCRQGGSTCTHS